MGRRRAPSEIQEERVKGAKLPSDERREQRHHVPVSEQVIGRRVVTIYDLHAVERVGDVERSNHVGHGRTVRYVESHPIACGPVGKISRQGSE